MITSKQIGGVKLLLHTGEDAKKLWGDNKGEAPKELYTYGGLDDPSGMIWETLEQFWVSHGMRLGLNLGPMLLAMQKLYDDHELITDPYMLARHFDLDNMDLDDFVHDLTSKTASNVNNEGLEAQINHITSIIGKTETVEAIKAIAKDKE